MRLYHTWQGRFFSEEEVDVITGSIEIKVPPLRERKTDLRALAQAEAGQLKLAWEPADLAEASANGTLYGSLAHGHGAPAAVKNAIYDVVTAHFNGEYDSAAAVEELVAAVQAAK